MALPGVTANLGRRHRNLQKRIPGNHERGVTGHNNSLSKHSVVQLEILNVISENYLTSIKISILRVPNCERILNHI